MANVVSCSFQRRQCTPLQCNLAYSKSAPWVTAAWERSSSSEANADNSSIRRRRIVEQTETRLPNHANNFESASTTRFRNHRTMSSPTPVAVQCPTGRCAGPGRPAGALRRSPGNYSGSPSPAAINPRQAHTRAPAAAANAHSPTNCSLTELTAR